MKHFKHINAYLPMVIMVMIVLNVLTTGIKRINKLFTAKGR